MRRPATLSSIGCVSIIGSIALLGCNPSFVPSAPTALGRVSGSAATSLSWACVTSGVDRGNFVASGWTITREACLSTPTATSVRNGVMSATGAALFEPAPTNLRATQVGRTVQLDWDQPPSASAWQVEAGSSPGVANIAVIRTSTRTLTITGVPQGSYYVRVRSATPDFSDVSVPSNEVLIFMAFSGCAGGAPRDFNAWVVGNSVTLSWNPPLGATDVVSYILTVGSRPEQSDLVFFDTRNTATTLQATAPNGVFYARIHSKTSCLESYASNEITIVVPSQTAMPPPPVADFTFGRFSAGSICSYRGCLFDATRSTGSGLSYFWDFADGSTGTGPLVLHQYARPPALRQMTVVLTVIDTFGRTNTTARNLYLDPNY